MNNDHQALLAYLYRSLDLLPQMPPSMYRTLQTSCLKALRRLHQQNALSPGEVQTLTARARAPLPERIES
jgi:hypothetical protein